MEDKPSRMAKKKNNYHPLLISMYLWYSWALVRGIDFLQNVSYYFGLYAPDSIITFLVGYYRMDYRTIEDDFGDLHKLHFKQITMNFDTVVNENSEKVPLDTVFAQLKDDVLFEQSPINDKLITYTYDITSRSLWYFRTIDDCCAEYRQYAIQCVPWDLKEHEFLNAQKRIKFIYEDSGPTRVLNIYNNEKFSTTIGKMAYDYDNIMYNTIDFVSRHSEYKKYNKHD